jgi:acyl carrier protein
MAVTTLERVQKIVASVLAVPVESVEPHAPLYQVTDLDSMHLAEIAAALDDEFAVRIADDDLGAAHTIEDLARIVTTAPAR